jgi:hypothetical protein
MRKDAKKVAGKKDIGDYCGIIIWRQVITGEIYSRGKLRCWPAAI